MDWKQSAAVFISVFVAELGDKTQLATMLFAGKAPQAKLPVFVAAASALVASTALAVLVGELVSACIGEQVLRWCAGIGFVAIGLWTLLRG